MREPWLLLDTIDCASDLPGRLHYIYDQYGATWNDEPFLAWIQALWFRRVLRRAFPEFQFRIISKQRNPNIPVPMYFYEFRDERDPWDIEVKEQAKIVEEELIVDSEF